MPWWKFRNEPQYKTDRGIAAVYALFAVAWYTIPTMKGGYVHVFCALAWAGLSMFHIVRSFKKRNASV